MTSRCGIDDARGDLLTELTDGFASLLEKVEILAAQNAELEHEIQKLQANGSHQFTPTKGSFTSSEVDGVEKGSRDIESILENDPRIVKGIQAYELLKLSMTGTIPLRRKRWRKISPNRTLIGPKPGFERDFTTQGTQGELKCPFSQKLAEIEEEPAASEPHKQKVQRKVNSSKSGRLPTMSGDGDVVSKSMSVTGSAAQCPIRFLNQLPAEEVAKYFEQHKHEIPRSHEICVKRYQANEQSIRSLDAKYGNLVNMIQGLGEKHQPMLPSKNGMEEEGEDAMSEVDGKSIEKVERWAKDCGEGPGPMGDNPEIDDKSDDRTGHFERPLKEVRLGESPSRPWGIQVPYNAQVVVDSNAPEQDSVAAPVQPVTNKDTHPEEPTKRPAGRCPFGHVPPAPLLKPQLDRQPNSQIEVPKQAPVETKMSFDQIMQPKESADNTIGEEVQRRQIVFNGPVFFGYSAESAATFLRALQANTTPVQADT